MHHVIQFVDQAKVSVDGKVVGQIGRGYVVLSGITKKDNEEIAHKYAAKIAKLRIIPDENGKLNLNLSQISGAILLISQFTLCADTDSNRPSFSNAAVKKDASKLLQIIKSDLENIYSIPVSTGQFGAHMKVEMVNHGPITVIF